MHVICKYERNKSLCYSYGYANHRGCYNRELSSNNNWMNGLYYTMYSHNPQTSTESLKTWTRDDSCTRNKYQRTKSLCYSYGYASHKGCCNRELSSNNNWMNGLYYMYSHNPQSSTQSHNSGARHVSCTRYKYQRTKSLCYSYGYTNHKGSWNWEQSLNNNWMNGLDYFW